MRDLGRAEACIGKNVYCKTLHIRLTCILATPRPWENPINLTEGLIMATLVLKYTYNNSRISCTMTLSSSYYKLHWGSDLRTSPGLYAMFHGSFKKRVSL